MKWWIKRTGRMEGPLSEEEIRKRIRLNLLGSLDRVSGDGNTWKYLKDSELWRPAVPRTVSSPFSSIESIEAPSGIHPSPSVIAGPVRTPIPERLQMPRQEVSPHGKNRALIWGLVGGLAVLLVVLICGGVVMAQGRKGLPRRLDAPVLARYVDVDEVVGQLWRDPPIRRAPLWKRAFACYRDNGLWYTIKRIFVRKPLLARIDLA